MEDLCGLQVSAVSLLVDDLNKSDVRLSPSAALSTPFPSV